MNKVKFSKPPISDKEKEKKADAFINLANENTDQFENKLRREPTKSIFLRAPQSFWKDIQEIMALTGLTMNAVCLELLRPALKKKLKELKEE
ncbi:MAG: hypothetical protein Q8929_00250 [Bacillota bacterium]|nr:hypothetical protein [Bacillota bacterium]